MPRRTPPERIADWFAQMPPEMQLRVAADLVENAHQYDAEAEAAARKSAAAALRIIADRLDHE